MNANSNETHLECEALAIGVWENEGGALGRDGMNHPFGRRIKADRSWTMLAHAGGDALVGLGRSDAARRMISLNLRNQGRRVERSSLMAHGLNAREIEAARQ